MNGRELRIGDAEREIALAALGDHFAQGRLSREEYDERADAVWTSRTAGDLRPLFDDLPQGLPPLPGQASVAPPAPPAARGSTGWPTSVRVGLAVALSLALLTNLPLVLIAGLLWFALCRQGRAARPPWSTMHHLNR